MREQISLNGTWQLKGTASYVPLRDKSMETGKPLEGVTGWMDAQVPGGVARALYHTIAAIVCILDKIKAEIVSLKST